MIKTKVKQYLMLFKELFRYPVVKIIILLSLHVIGAIFIGVVFYISIQAVLGYLGILGGQLMVSLWNFLHINLLPPLVLILSVIVATISNPIYALVSLILIFLMSAIFLITLQVEFLALIYIIIYIGAIAILFLFVIMMFNLKELRDAVAYYENKDFLILSFNIYLFLLYKIYHLLSGAFMTYLEYDTYMNEVLFFKYNGFIARTQEVYWSFLYDYQREIQKIVWDNTSLAPNGSQVFNDLSINNNLRKNNIDSTLYEYYLTKDHTVSQNLLKSPTNVYETALEKMPTSLIHLIESPNDILNIGYSLYTQYSYLFLLVTMVLLIAMVGAIVLALSTNETSPLNKKFTK